MRNNRDWWSGPRGEAPRRLLEWFSANESTPQAWRRRWRNRTLNYYATGRDDLDTYAFSSVPRPSSIARDYGRVKWPQIKYNRLAQCSEVLASKVYRQRPELFICPIAGDSRLRLKSKRRTRWLQAAFDTLKVWELVQLCGLDCRTNGTGYLMVGVGDDDQPELTRIHDDEVVVDEAECQRTDTPRTLGLRFFIPKSEAIERWADTDEAKLKIERAPAANLGFHFDGPLETEDFVVLRYAWHLGTKKTPGRYMVMVGDYVVEDEKFTKDRYPVARLFYSRMSKGFRGKGMFEDGLSDQRFLEKQLSAVEANISAFAWPHIGIESGSGVAPATLVGKPGGSVFTYTQTLPQFITPQAVGADVFRSIQDTATRISERIGISEQSARVEPVSGESAVAIEKRAQLDQGRHAELSLHLQDFVKEVGELLLDAASECKPTVTESGRRITKLVWDSKLDLDKDKYDVRTLDLSALPSSMSGRQQILDTWFSQGRISKATMNRLEQVPDLDGYEDLTNAGADWVQTALDSCAEDLVYEPPSTMVDLADQVQQAENRYLLEKLHGDVEPEALDLLMRFLFAAKELVEEQAKAAPPLLVPPQGPGVLPAGPAQPPAPGP